MKRATLTRTGDVDADSPKYVNLKAMKLKGVGKKCATFRFMQQLMLRETPAIMFKRGFKSNWTWGFLWGVSERQIQIISPYTGTALLSEPGDCGATWFGK
jgi:hypothetical protein